MRVVIAALSCLLALPTFASTLTPDNEARILEQCGAGSQAGMRDCLTKRMVETERVLGDSEKKTAVAIAAWDEDEKFIRAAQARLTAASQAFERYREAQCALSVSLGGGAIGNALELRRLACVAAANEIRAEQLRHWSESLPRR
jgi:Lysozyme inhibitor LprI